MRESTGTVAALATSCRTLRRDSVMMRALVLLDHFLLDHSGLTPEAFTTLAHFSVSVARCAPNSTGVNSIGAVPTSASLALMLASLRQALNSRLSRSTISCGVPAGTPMPNHVLDS